MKIFILIFLAITSEATLAGDWGWDWAYRLNSADKPCYGGKNGQLVINYEVSEYGDQVATDTEDSKTPKVFWLDGKKAYTHNIENSERYGEWCPSGEGNPCRSGGKRIFSQKINADFIGDSNIPMFGYSTLKFSYPLISIDYHYPQYRLEHGKSKATVFLVDENCNSEKICEVSVEMGKTASPICEYQIKLSNILDDKNNSVLLARQKLKEMIEHLNSVDKIKNFKEINVLDQIIEEVIDKPFEEISREDLLEYDLEFVVARYDSLLQNVEQLVRDIESKKNEINKTLEKIKADIKNDFASQGIDIENQKHFVFDDFNIDLTIEFPEVFEVEEEITKSNNIYDEMAQKTIDQLSLLYRQNDRKDFLKTVLSWINSSQEILKIILNERGGIYDGEENLYEESIKKVENYLYVSPGYLDRSLWFKDSPVPVDVRELLDKSITRSDPQVGLAFTEELKSWGGKPLTEKQKNLLKTIRVLGYGFDYIYKSFGNTANEALERWKEIAAGVVEVAATAGCLTVAAAAGNGGDLYELSSGRDLCDPSKELTPAGYTIASFSLFIGNSKTLRGISELFGITTAVKISIKKAGDLFELAKKFGFKSKEQLNGFQNILKLFTSKQGVIDIKEVGRVLDSAKDIGLSTAGRIKQLAESTRQHGAKVLSGIIKSKSFKRAVKASPSNKPMFYVKTTGEAIPSTGYRYVPSNAAYLDGLVSSGRIPANPATVADPYRATYFGFDKFDDAATASTKFQVPHDAAIRVEFDTLQVIDDVKIPNGKWNTDPNYLEPITKDFPEHGVGGAAQAITNAEVRASRIVDLRTGEVLYERN